MVVLKTSNKSQIFEVDSSVFEEVKDFLKKLSKKKNKTFSYTDSIGDTIVVVNGKEYVVPTSSDIEAFYNIDNSDFLDENEVKKLLDV